MVEFYCVESLGYLYMANAPFRIETMREAKWAKDWLLKQISNGSFPGLRVEVLRHLDSLDAVRRFLNDHLTEVEDRQRLQKALSARRSRALQKKNLDPNRKVTTELEYEARDILLAVAKNRGITTSELIRSSFLAE